MAGLNRVSIVDVSSDNFREVWPTMILAMSSSSFIALDTELSGLGNRKKLNAKSMEERYINIREAARSRSILSLGISCFKLIDMPGVSTQRASLPKDQTGGRVQSSSYIVQTFNILLLCEEDYVVEPASLQFLVQHGFDFNKQYDKGMPYYRGEDKEMDMSVQSIRHLFRELVFMQIPIVLHNGLVDLMYLYENLYTSLPQTSAMFLADLVDMFSGGIVDTKYITDYEHLMQASYLEYVFRKCLKDNNECPSVSCSIHFPHYPESYPYVTYRSCNYKPAHDISSSPQEYIDALCGSYAGHGWCSKGKYCQKSHDIDLIIDVDNYNATKKSRKRRRQKERQQMRKSQVQEDGEMSEIQPSSDCTGKEEDTTSDCMGKEEDIYVDEDSCNKALKAADSVSKSSMALDIPVGESAPKSGGHRAGYDAFMTGFIYAVFLSRMKAGHGSKIEEWKNKLYLCGKDYPLTVTKSAFSKQSKQHLDKIASIRTQNQSLPVTQNQCS